MPTSGDQRETAIELMKAGRSNAEVWEALVAKGMDGETATALVSELDELRNQAKAAAAPGCARCGAPSPSYMSPTGEKICNQCYLAHQAVAPLGPPPDTFPQVMRGVRVGLLSAVALIAGFMTKGTMAGLLIMMGGIGVVIAVIVMALARRG